MSTNADIINDSLREINVIGETVSASPEQGAYCLRVLNRMIEMWTEGGIQIGYFKQSATTDTITIPEWAELGVVTSLAVTVASHYGATVSAELAKSATEGYRVILRKSIVDKVKTADLQHLPQGEGKYRFGRNILTDV